MDPLDSELQSLFTHDRFVRRVARGIVSDAAADDVVQDTWWAAINRPPDRTRPLLPWLRALARNFALKTRRGEARRREREAAVSAPEASPSAAALVEREATRRAVVNAVLALPEPMREAVILRYFDGLPPRAIAKRTGEPVETVKSRLKRALVLLRTKLDPGHAHERRTFGAALVALAQGPSGAAGLSAAAAVETVILGALAMTKGAKLAAGFAALIVLLTGGWWVSHTLDFDDDRTVLIAPAETPLDRPQPAPEHAGPVKPAVAEAPAIVPKSFVEAPDRTIAPTSGLIRGEVLDIDRTPAADVPVVVFDMRDGAPHSQASQRTQTDEQGRFSLNVPTPLAWKIALVAFKPMRRPATLIIDGEQADPVTLALGEGAAIEGVVRVDGHQPRQGNFTMLVATSGSLIRFSTGRISADIRFGVPGCFSGNDELWWAGTAFETKLAAVSCDAEGKFRIAGLARDTYRIDASNLVDDSGLNLDVRADVTAPATGVELGLATARLRIRLEGNGRVLQGGRVSVVNPEGNSIRTESADPLEFRVGAGVPLTVEAACAGFAQRSVPVPPLVAGEVRDLTIELDPAKTASLRLTLRGAEAMNLDRVSVRFVPLAESEGRATSALEDLRETLVAERSRADEFVLEHLPLNPGSYILVVLPPTNDSWILPFEKDVTVPTEGVLAVTRDTVFGGRVDVAAVDPDGNAFSGRWSLRDGNGIEALSGHVFGAQRVEAGQVRKGVPLGGSMTMRSGGIGMAGVSSARIHAGIRASSLRRGPGIVPAGSYELVLEADGFKTARRTVTVVGGTVARVEVRLEAASDR